MKVTLHDHVPAECDAVATSDAETTFYHTRPWLECVDASYQTMSLACLVAEDGGGVVGYLPFFFVHTGPFRRAWSLPFGTYGGPLSAGGAQVRSALMARYTGLLSRPRVVEVGWIDYTDPAERDGWETRPSETHVVDLTGGFDDVWENRLGRDRRKRARRAERLGVAVERSLHVADLRAHYDVYVERMRGFGTSVVQPWELFERLFTTASEQVRLYVARHEGEVVGAHFNFCHRDTVIAWYGMATERGDELQAGTLLYVECMRESCRDGFGRYNLGGSLGKPSLASFKESLGGQPYTYATRLRRSLLGRAGAAMRGLGRRA
jgi:CelD/BcsL family acetyltransferase involved in cellulose biosynthesis